MTTLASPYVLRKKNLIVTKASRYHAAACFELNPIHFDYKKRDEYDQLLYQMESLIAKLRYSGMFLMVPVAYDPTNDLTKGTKPPEVLVEPFEKGIKRMKGHMVQIPYQYRTYLILFVEQVTSSLIEEMVQAFWETIRDVTKKTEHLLAGEPYTISSREWKEFERKEELVYKLVSSYFPIRRLEPIETDWLVNRCAMRGVDPQNLTEEDYVDGFESPEAFLLSSDPVRISRAFQDVMLDKRSVPGMLRFEKEFPEGPKTGYFSFLTVSRLPKGSGSYPGETTLFHTIQDQVPCPVELCIQFQPIHTQEVKWKLKASKHISKGNANRQWSNSAEIQKLTQNVIDESTELQEYLNETEYPMFRTRITLCTWGETPEIVYQNRAQIAKALASYELQVPKKMQRQLFYNTLPGFPKNLDSQYFLRLTTEWLAATMPMATSKIGDPSGFLIGYTGNQELSPVLLNPRRGSDDSKRAATGSSLIQGAPGSGKSMLANYMIHQELMRGAKALIFDPKNERWHWPHALPHLQKVTTMVTLRDTEEDQGKLDPLARITHGDQDALAISFAKSILNFLANRQNDSIYEKVIEKAVDKVIVLKMPSLMKVIDQLEQYLDGKLDFGFHDSIQAEAKRAAADIHATLQMRATSGLTRLLFHDGTKELLDLTNPLTILQIQGLWGGTQEDTTENRNKKAVFLAVLDLARQFADEEQEYRTILIDEAYFITDDPEGANLLRVLLRTGRSKRNNVILCTHNARDIQLEDSSYVDDGGGEVRSNVTNRFVYRIDDRQEAIRACDLLGIDPTKQNVEQLMDKRKMSSGSYFMRDFDGNVGQVKFPLHQIDPDLYRCFQTSDPEILKERDEKWGKYRTPTTKTSRLIH